MLLDVNFWYKIFRNFRADRRGFAVNVCGPSFVADAGGTPMCAPTAQQRSSQKNFVVIFLLLMALAKIQTLPMGLNLEKIFQSEFNQLITACTKMYIFDLSAKDFH